MVEEGNNPVILMPITALCQEMNQSIIKNLGNKIHTISAKDTLETPVPQTILKKVESAYQKIKSDGTRTGGLERQLELCVNARVMLKRNLNIESGLVDGALGTVNDFRFQNETVVQIEIKFDKIDNPVLISRETTSLKS